MAGIFKAYDIRGTYPDQLNEETARRIGNAFAQFIGGKRYVVGRDMRLSSDKVARALIDGMTDAGADCTDVGVIETPMSYFAIGYYGFDGGVMTTASHNPAKYNGFKLSREKAIPLSEETGIAEIEKMVNENRYYKADKKGSIVAKDVFPDYRKHVLAFAEEVKPLTVVIDAGNGMGGKVLPFIFTETPIKIVPLYFELDGSFPNHEANPLKPQNMVDLQKKVAEARCDFGVAFDGDADRVIFVDENARTIGPDLLTALIAKEVLAKEKGASILYDLRSSRIVPETIEAAGGKPVRERVGHAFMKATLRETGAVFGGELSGHYYFRDNYCADSGVIAFIKILNLLSSTGEKLSSLLEPLKKYHQSGEINFEVEDKDAKIEEIARDFSDGEIDYLDGITVQYKDWWFNVRKSNTEPVLRLNAEADTADLLEKGKGRLMKLLGAPMEK
jgi:phosphomannomutase